MTAHRGISTGKKITQGYTKAKPVGAKRKPHVHKGRSAPSGPNVKLPKG